MSLKPDDIRRIASVLQLVAESDERAHKPLLSTLHAIVEVPERSDFHGWKDWPDLLIREVEHVGHSKSLRFLRLERGAHGWTVVWRRTERAWGKDLIGLAELASTPQDSPELVLRAELARLNAIPAGESA